MKYYLLGFLTFVCCATAAAYTRITLSSGETPTWFSMPVSYWINEKGLSQISNGSEFEAVQASFQTWENVPSANVQFVYRGATPAAGVGSDGINVVSFSDPSTPLGSSTIAATFSFFRLHIGNDGLIHQYIEEADIVFNPALDFSTSAEAGKFDIQSVLTHEVGHLLGLDHSALVSSVMVPFGAVSQLDQRTLAYDDIAGITEIYPRTPPTGGVGQIRGTVRIGSASVFGANVVAVNADGTPLVSTLSQPDGSYVLRFLPPGTYRVFAEPLDLPVAKENIGGGSGGFYSSVRTDFGTTYFGDASTLAAARAIDVTANGTATANITTLPPGTTGLNLTRPAFAPRVARGARGSLTVGGEDITAGVSFSTSNPGLVLGSPIFGGRISTVASTSARLDLSVSTTTPLGPKNVAVSRDAPSILAGAVVITDPGPTSIAVSPTSGPTDGGTAVTITGSNFRAGAQVYFGGIAAPTANVINSSTIFANAPQNSPGSMNIVVVNFDGTWGSAPGAFTYNTVPPVITRVTPSEGSPTTLVTIEGENFDSHLQNVAIQFNGVSARVLTATTGSMTTLVPFGATTGPITVSVFGKPTTGPTFNVTPPAASTNVASPAFNFIDASSNSGGLNLAFGNADDAVASSTLPFTFSLFRDIYLAGATVSITTNGFLSLENLSVSEFQNGALPGQTVARPSGSSGVIPASLIAPFWDDLMLKGNSTVSTRTVGDAPNRRFVVEWSNLSILDENGTDQNAVITFEAVLFEGSNDIQFIYSGVDGPRSDGSSATIGLQDLKRVLAVQSGFNQAIVSANSVRTYHFDNGAYTELIPDNTPPTRPVISDEGALTANRTQLAASWTSDDPESAIQEFQYAVGTSPGGTDVKPFTSTNQNSIVITGLNLSSAVTYYFAVKAINAAGLVSDVGLSDGIRYDPAYQPQIKIIPSAPESQSDFTGLAFLAPTAMTVVLRAYDANGAMILGPGIRNPATVTLTAGQQYARLIRELLGLQNFDGWIEVEASAAGLGIFTASGGWNMATLDGAIVREPSADFVLFHTGASAILVNPSTRAANVTMTKGPGNFQSFSIPPRTRLVTTLTAGSVRVQSSEPLAAVERSYGPGKLAINAAVPVSEARSTIVFPHALVGGGYKTTLWLFNPSGTEQNVSITAPASTGSVRLEPSSWFGTGFGTTQKVGASGPSVGTATVTATALFGEPGIVAVLDIEDEHDAVTVGARPAATDFTFPHVANGNGLFTGLALAAGNGPAKVTIDVYEPAGGPPKSGTVTLAPNQQLSRLVSELVSGVATQIGGYIRIRSDQPIWAWEIYGSGQVMASGPPL